MTEASNRPGAAAAPKAIMVVDRDILARMAIADYLRGCGYKVIEAASGDDVRAVLAAGHALDVLLIDMQLQGSEDGFALAKAIRAEHPEILIIRTVNAARLSDRAAELCDDGPLEKPYHPQELLRRIQGLREQQRRSDG
jgi:DNA-binding response OmpR family regulator